MLNQLRNYLTRLYSQKKIVVSVSLFCAASLVILMSYKNGAAKNGETVTGAPFNNSKTCAKCHSGGSFGGTIKTQLLNSNKTAVKTYVPGLKYTLKITLKKTSPKSVKYGFQTTAATSTNANINKWGTLPTNTHNTLKSGHNYVEQSAPLTSGIISIPWTGPVKGTGTIKFYTAGNIVNGNGSESGDQPINNSLTIKEGVAPVPVALNNFSGTVQGRSAVISWSTSNENGIESYVIEKSTINDDFKSLKNIMAKGGGNYEFTDADFSGKCYYRVKVIDSKGDASYSDAVTVVQADKNNYKLSLYAHSGYPYIMFSNESKAQKVQVIYTDIQGRILNSGVTYANEGDNAWEIPSLSANGIIIVSVLTEDGFRTSIELHSKQ